MKSIWEKNFKVWTNFRNLMKILKDFNKILIKIWKNLTFWIFLLSIFILSALKNCVWWGAFWFTYWSVLLVAFTGYCNSTAPSLTNANTPTPQTSYGAQVYTRIYDSRSWGHIRCAVVGAWGEGGLSPTIVFKNV